MPISKTCYFCGNLMGKHAKCQKHWKKSSFTDSHSVIACKDDFTPNADWLYIEQLEKENEELKKELVGWRSSHNWSGKVPEYKTESTTNNDYVVITNTNNEVKP
jgi:hypothetical protein